MADEIKQELGFDASQALETINQLNTGFDSLFQTLNASSRAFDSFNSRGEQTVNTLAKIAAQVSSTQAKLTGSAAGNALDQLLGQNPGGNNDALKADRAVQALRENMKSAQSAASSLGNEVEKTGNATANAMNKSARSTAGFALSLETVTRVLGTQVIVRTLSAIQRGITESFGDFIKLQDALGQLGTISQQSLGQLERELVLVSDAFNVPLLDTVKAKYQILQNGFKGTSESADVLAASLKFARIANIDAATSAGLVSGALNAAGESASSAEQEASKFVKTLGLAKISGQELATAVGRFAPLGEEIGASNDELLAAFSTLVAGGVKTNEASTQVRASLVALLKPSKDLEEAFKKLGVANGAQAIQTFGFKGAIEAVIGTTDRSQQSIEKLFPSMRALTGVLIEAGGGAERFADHLKQTKAVAADFAQQQFNIRINTDAEQVTADLNKLHNFLTTEVGRTLVETTGDAIKFVGGIDNVITASRALVPILGVATAGLIVYGTAAGLASASNRLFAASTVEGTTTLKRFGGALAVVGAAFAAFEAGKAIGSFITDSLNAEQKAVVDAGQHRLEVERAHDAKQSQIKKDAADQNLKIINQAIAREQAAYNTELEGAKDTNQKLIEDDKSTLDRILQAHEKFASDLRAAAQAADEQVVKSKEISNDQIAKLSDEKFNHETKKLTELSQVQEDQQRGNQIAALGLKQLLSAHTEKEADAARKSLDRADGYKKQAIELAKGLGFIQNADELEREQNQIIEQRIAAELKFQKIREADADRLRSAAAEEDKRNDKIKALSKTFLDNSKLFDNKGNPLPEDEITKRAVKAREALNQLQKELLSGNKNVSISDLFSFDDLQRRLDEKVSGADVKQLGLNQKAADGLIDEIQGSIDKHGKFVVDVAVSLGADKDTFSKLSRPEAFKSAVEQNQQAEEQRKKQIEGDLKRRDIERQIANEQANSAESRDRDVTTSERAAKAAQRLLEILTPTSAANGQTDELVGIEQQRIDGLRDSIQQGLSDPNVSKGFIENLAAKLDDFSQHASISLNIDTSKALTEFQSLVTVFQKRAELQDLDKQGLTPEALKKSEDQLQNATERARLEGNVATALSASATSTEAAAQASSVWLANVKGIAAAQSVDVDAKFNAAKAAVEAQNAAAGGQPIQTPGFQTKAPVTVEPQPGQGASIGGGINFTLNQEITTNDPQQLARDLIPAMNREFRRNASALRTA